MTAIFRQIFFWLPFVLVLLLISLSFYQHPVADDFAGNYIASKIGIIGAIRSYLVNGTGRYFVVSVFIVICSSRFLLDHYFIVPILFFVATYCNLFFFIREIWKTFFETGVILRRLHWLTAASMLLLLTSMEEVSTFFIWITTCCIFLLSFNLLLLYTRLVIRFNFSEIKPAKWLYSSLILCIILLCGCEESTLFFSLLLNLFVCYLLWTWKKRIRFAVFLFLLQLVFLIIVFLMPGNRMRTHNFSTAQPFYFSAISAFYQMVFMFFRILSNPLCWFFAVSTILAGPHFRLAFQHKGGKRENASSLYLPLVGCAIYFFYFFIRHFGGRVIPPYANNLIICYVIIIGFVFISSKKIFFGDVAKVVTDFVTRLPLTMYIPCILLFLFSVFTQDLIQSLVTAPVHDEVYNDRKSKIEQAKAHGKTSVKFDNYQDACIKVLTDKYGGKAATFVKNLFHFPPKYIYTNEAHVDFSYAAYYKIDTIYTGSKYILSWDKAYSQLWNVK